MTGDVIKSFLVGLGFEVDDSSLSKFNKAISSATIRVTALYTSVKVAAAAVTYAISKISESFEQLGYEYKIIAPAINKALILRREMMKAYAATGVNLVRVVQNAVKLNISLTKTKYIFEALYKSVASRFFVYLTKQSDKLRQKIYENLPRIQDILEKFVRFIFKALEVTTQLGERVWSILGRVYELFKKLHDVTGGLSTGILAAVAAWKLLNLSFLATPLGMIIAGLTAILFLYDDFLVWKEGGKSFFNWSSAVPIINSVADAVKNLRDFMVETANAAINFILAWKQWRQGDSQGAKESVGAGVSNLGGAASGLGGAAFGIGSAEAGIALRIRDSLFGLLGIKNDIFGNPIGGTPLGATGGNVNRTTQSLNQQTVINVNGTADANAVGNRILGEQGRVNMDMARNLKGATR